MWTPLVAKFSHEDHPAVSTIATTTLLASPNQLVDGSVVPWRPDEEYVSQVFFDTISPRSALSTPEILVDDSSTSSASSTRTSKGRNLSGA